jgi:hypothetical protein
MTIYNLPLAMSQEKVSFANHPHPRHEATWYQHRCFPVAIDGRYAEALGTWGLRATPRVSLKITS